MKNLPQDYNYSSNITRLHSNKLNAALFVHQRNSNKITSRLTVVSHAAK